MAKIGDNSRHANDRDRADLLRQFYHQVREQDEAMQAAQKRLAAIYVDMRNHGFDDRALRAVARRKALPQEQRAKLAELEEVIAEYEEMLADQGDKSGD